MAQKGLGIGQTKATASHPSALLGDLCHFLLHLGAKDHSIMETLDFMKSLNVIMKHCYIIVMFVIPSSTIQHRINNCCIRNVIENS